MNKKKNYREIEDAEFGVDSRYISNEDRIKDSAALMEARLQRLKKLSHDEIAAAKLMQLKLKMEGYIHKPVYDNHNHFSQFVMQYIDAIYSKRSAFAKDINVSPTSLSQVINNHREPKEEFILKLMIHSEKVYKNVCEFHKKTWYQVYFHEKICDTMSNQDEWRPKIEKEVKLSEYVK